VTSIFLRVLQRHTSLTPFPFEFLGKLFAEAVTEIGKKRLTLQVIPTSPICAKIQPIEVSRETLADCGQLSLEIVGPAAGPTASTD
jgi:hypothetical protein